MNILKHEEFLWELNDINNLISTNAIKSDNLDYEKPLFGEIWVCQIPILHHYNGKILFETISRPILVLDDGHEYFVKHDNKNYYVLKITSQKDSYQRIPIKNYKEIGLQKESFVRIEVPLKVEKEQFLYRIGKLSHKETIKYLKKVQSFIQNSMKCI